MFGFIKKKLTKIYNQFTSKIAPLFSTGTFDEQTLKELEKLLISADTGIKTTRTIIKELKEEMLNGSINDGKEAQEALEKKLLALLANRTEKKEPSIFLLVGINGSGKTTCAGKLAYHLKNNGKKVLLVAADTFRAAAQEQLQQWAEKTESAIECGKPNQDPASVVFTGLQRFKQENFDTVIIDTAGRLQTKTNLMRELEKIKRIIKSQAGEHTLETLLTIDAMLGQNSLQQARIFNESTDLNGIILTKIDGTGKGGIVFAICQELTIPISYISFGENIQALRRFDPEEYVSQLLS